MKLRLLTYASVVMVIVVALFGARHLLAIANVASAFYAKTLCSGIFVSGRDAEVVIAEDVLADMTGSMRRFRADIERKQGLVISSVFGLAHRSALYRPGLGCTLVNATTPEALRRQAEGFVPLIPALDSGAPWPKGRRVDTGVLPEGVDAQRLSAALDAGFAEPYEDLLRRTRAVVVVFRGRIIAERYSAGITPDMPLAGWSMGKSVANALAGVLTREGVLDVEKSALFPEWLGPGDPRGGITVNHLLRMTSGLDFDHPHARMLSDVRKMLFVDGDAAAYAKSKPASVAPGLSWTYGSGDSVILSHVMRRALGGKDTDYFNFPRRALFAKLGMSSAVAEPDASGSFLFPAFVHASPRDWARFGLFILNDGIWEGERILPEGWVEYSLMPTPQSGGDYAAHFWRRVPDFLRPVYASPRQLPDDRFYMLGHDGQMIAVVPSRQLAVLRLGLSRRRDAWDPDELLADMLEALPGGAQ